MRVLQAVTSTYGIRTSHFKETSGEFLSNVREAFGIIVSMSLKLTLLSDSCGDD